MHPGHLFCKQIVPKSIGDDEQNEQPEKKISHICHLYSSL